MEISLLKLSDFIKLSLFSAMKNNALLRREGLKG